MSLIQDYQLSEANHVEKRLRDILYHLIDTKEALLRASDAEGKEQSKDLDRILKRCRELEGVVDDMKIAQAKEHRVKIDMEREKVALLHRAEELEVGPAI